MSSRGGGALLVVGLLGAVEDRSGGFERGSRWGRSSPCGLGVAAVGPGPRGFRVIPGQIPLAVDMRGRGAGGGRRSPWGVIPGQMPLAVDAPVGSGLGRFWVVCCRTRSALFLGRSLSGLVWVVSGSCLLGRAGVVSVSAAGTDGNPFRFANIGSGRAGVVSVSAASGTAGSGSVAKSWVSCWGACWCGGSNSGGGSVIVGGGRSGMWAGPWWMRCGGCSVWLPSGLLWICQPSRCIRLWHAQHAGTRLSMLVGPPWETGLMWWGWQMAKLARQWKHPPQRALRIRRWVSVALRPVVVRQIGLPQRSKIAAGDGGVAGEFVEHRLR